jgi:hypothetical protein
MEMLPVIAWKMYYSDSEISSEESSWEDAPSEDVQAVFYIHGEPYLTTSSGVDEYFMPGSDHVKYGKYMTDEDFEKRLEYIESEMKCLYSI